MKYLIFCILVASACALPNRRRQLKPRGKAAIVGGEDAGAGEFPYQISFQEVLNILDPFHFCGGSVYNENYVITAAHCVEGEDFNRPENLQIVAGALNLKEFTGTEQTRAVVKIIQHEDYGSIRTKNDIALLQLESPLEFDDYVEPVVLPAQGKDTTGTCTVTGWGTLTEGGITPDTLQKVDVPVVTDEKCRDDYSDAEVLDSMICAGAEGKDSCQGDSGGPLYCSGYLGGIVSWGYGCAEAGYPGVYTEVSYFVDWIVANAV